MVQQIEAVYENGVLRPLQPLHLKEATRVQVAVSDGVSDTGVIDMIDYRLLAYARARTEAWEKAEDYDEGRTSLSEMQGSLSELIISERGEY